MNYLDLENTWLWNDSSPEIRTADCRPGECGIPYDSPDIHVTVLRPVTPSVPGSDIVAVPVIPAQNGIVVSKNMIIGAAILAAFLLGRR